MPTAKLSEPKFAGIDRNALNFHSNQKDEEFIISDKKVPQNEKERPKNGHGATNKNRLFWKIKKTKKQILKSGKQNLGGQGAMLVVYIYPSPGGRFWGFCVTFYQKTNLFLSVFGIMGKFYR